jgi:hypothetical protein
LGDEAEYEDTIKMCPRETGCGLVHSGAQWILMTAVMNLEVPEEKGGGVNN